MSTKYQKPKVKKHGNLRLITQLDPVEKEPKRRKKK